MALNNLELFLKILVATLDKYFIGIRIYIFLAVTLRCDLPIKFKYGLFSRKF